MNRNFVYTTLTSLCHVVVLDYGKRELPKMYGEVDEVVGLSFPCRLLLSLPYIDEHWHVRVVGIDIEYTFNWFHSRTT